MKEDRISRNILWQMIKRLAPDSRKVAEWVSELKNRNPDLSKDELAEYIGKRIVRTYTGQGVALALPGAVPGLGTAVQATAEVTAISADVSLMIRNQVYLVLALGHCYGLKGREVLLQDALICMGLWSNTLSMTKRGAIRLGTITVESNFRRKFPARILQAINKKVGRTILTKYGTKRGGIAIGKLIPLGVGTVLGGSFNYCIMRKFKRHAIEYLSLKA